MPAAVSPAAARGLTQFVLPTARRVAIAARTFLRPGARDLDRPAVAIALGASYLAELAVAVPGARGGAGRRLQRRGGPGGALATLLFFPRAGGVPRRKIGFRETRAYVQRVLGSRAHYAALYGGGLR